MTGRGRTLTVSAGPACESATPASGPASAGAAPLQSACSLDARGLSRHFDVTGGAVLRLENVTLLNGAAAQGGSVLVVGGSNFSAAECTFAGSASVGEGGALLGLGNSTLNVDSSALTARACRPQRLRLSSTAS